MVMTFMGLVYTLRKRVHIRVIPVIHFLTGCFRTMYGMVCTAVGFLFCIALTCCTFELFWVSVVNKTRSMQITEIYLAFPQLFVPLGSSLLALQLISEFLKGTALLRKGTHGITIMEEMDELGR